MPRSFVLRFFFFFFFFGKNRTRKKRREEGGKSFVWLCVGAARGAQENQLVTNYIKDKNRGINGSREREGEGRRGGMCVEREKENGSRVNV